MSTEQALNKYFEVTQSTDFVSYEKAFASSIVNALSEGYYLGLDEPDLVDYIKKVVGKLNGLNGSGSKPYFRIAASAVFIHGSISQVKFDYYREKHKQRELGDLVFIVSMWFRGKKYFEKFTINQFKKDSKNSRTSSWKIDDGQLFLLSRFPTFRGITGSLVKETDYSLPAYSGCLGSYGLLFKPGDFAFVSAAQLSSYLGNGRSINKNDLYEFRNPCYYYKNAKNTWFNQYTCPFPIVNGHPFRDFFGSSCLFSPDTYDFVQNYLRMRIGEPIVFRDGVVNLQAKMLLEDLLNNVKAQASQRNLYEVSNFTAAYLNNDANGFDGRDFDNSRDSSEDSKTGLGIVHVRVDLGE
jgi:hypothetical protein